MGRPLPKLDKGRSFATVLPVTEDGVAFKQGGYSFRPDGTCVESALTPEQRDKHFGDGPDHLVLTGSSRYGLDIDLSDTVSVKQASVVAQAHMTSGLTVDEWNTIPAEDRETLIDAAVASLKAMLNVTEGAPAPRKVTTVGTVAEKPAEPAPAPREPEKFAPADPVVVKAAAKPAKPAKPAAVDLAAFVKGDGKFHTQEVIAAVKAKYGKGLRSAEQVREYLIAEHGFKP